MHTPDTAPSPCHPDSAWLWNDTACFDARYEKIAASLIAVRDTLHAQRPLAGGEADFLDLYERFAGADTDAFTRIWHDPYAYFWSRMAFEILAAVLGQDPLPAHVQRYAEALGVNDAKSLLRVHLDQCQRLWLGLAHASGTDCRLHTPLTVELPFAIPASPLSVCGNGHATLHGVRAGRLQLRHADRQCEIPLAPGARDSEGTLAVMACPVITAAGCDIRLQAHAFHNLPGLNFTLPVREAGSALHAERAALVTAAIEVLARHAPHSFAQFRELISVIGLKHYASGDYTNISYSDLSGAIVVSVIDNPYDLADTFIHELHHQRLFFLEEDGRFLDDDTDDLEQSPKHYSPWRNDPRPLHGLLHAVYVHVPVVHYWLSLAASGAVDAPHQAYAMSRAARLAWQMRIGIDQLARHATFTASGQRLLAGLQQDVAEIWARVGAALGEARDSDALLCEAGGRIVAQRHGETGQALSVAAAIRDHVERQARPPEREQVLAGLRQLRWSAALA